jgi:DNA-binding transcriptional ArsR family regulator
MPSLIVWRAAARPPSAVSQHLRFLYRGGLLTRQRTGRAVLYQASELGLALLTASAASDGRR